MKLYLCELRRKNSLDSVFLHNDGVTRPDPNWEIAFTSEAEALDTGRSEVVNWVNSHEVELSITELED